MSEKQSVWSQSLSWRTQMKVMWGMIKMAAPVKYLMLTAVLFTGIVAALNAIGPKILSTYMDSALTKSNTTWSTIVYFAVVYAVIRLLSAFFDFWWTYNGRMGAEKLIADVRIKMYRHIHSLGMRYFDQTPAGSIVTRVNNDTATFLDFWNFTFTLLTAVFAIIGAYIGMVITNAKVTAWLLLIVPVIIGLMWFYQRFSSSMYRYMRERLSTLNAKIAESVTGIAVIQNFHQEARFEQEFNDISREHWQARFRMIKVDALILDGAIDVLYGVSLVLALYLFGEMSFSNVVAGGTIYAFTTYLQNVFNPLETLMSTMSTFQEAMVSGYRVQGVLAEAEFEPQQKSAAQGKITAGKIEFRHVNFSYDGQHPVLKDLSFVAEPGQTVALVGHTGSGKSSTINALMRFYEFQSGEILIDDQDIRAIQPQELRQKMGLVLQEPFMFYGDVAFNIRMYDDNITDEQIKAAAEFVGANRVIEPLAGGYQAPVLEGGASLSAGEKQLISFARTVVQDPKILILDEATAHIDTESENLIQESLQKLRQNRTTIAIAHRLSTIKDADLILVLDKGEVIERGTHEELLAMMGRYYDLYRLQGETTA
ncbi:MAG TPA: ABC transporter ATP-binding protein [Lactobacillaceae bacterium]|jgi:ATP-binding cassette subfamily B protein